MTIKNVCIYILIVCASFVCGVISLAAEKMIALCLGLILGGAAILAAAFLIYAVAKDKEQKKQLLEEQKPVKMSGSSTNGTARKRV